MQGPSHSLNLRLRVSAAFAGAFLLAAVAIFALASALGHLLGLAGLPLAWRHALAAAALVALAAVDVASLRRASYCPLGWRRQTPRGLRYRHPPVRVAALWGLDTGLAFTTFRVAALTWGAFVLSLLGFAGWWLGLAYGLGFVIPTTWLLWSRRVGRAAAQGGVDPGLESLLRRRPLIQFVSSLLLAAVGAALIVEWLA
ncbi:MAG TPA: hypothetical protein VKU40_14580 [Thermoanaerobaculia bacterium]|nr:hypothetical protein [Thermoanaerobaculia bacterium]